MFRFINCSVVFGLLALITHMIQAGEIPKSGNTETPIAERIAFRASTLLGINVRNGEGQVVGMISDLVVDLSDNHVRYLTVSYGGFLGLGDKLFAIPADLFQVRLDSVTNKHYLVLDIPTEKLKAAPGFNPKQWPNFADKKWQQVVNDYYGPVK